MRSIHTHINPKEHPKTAQILLKMPSESTRTVTRRLEDFLPTASAHTQTEGAPSVCSWGAGCSLPDLVSSDLHIEQKM